MNIYLVITFGGILGLLLHALKTINGINKKYDHTSFNQVFYEYWRHDKLAFITAVFCFGVLLFVSSEFVNLNNLEAVDNSKSLKERLFNFRLASFIKCASVIAGYFADSLVYGFMGVTEKKLDKQFKDAQAQIENGN